MYHNISLIFICLFICINLSFCNKIIDKNYIDFNRGGNCDPDHLYYIGNDNFLNFYDGTHTTTSFVPLMNPKILGSFSNQSMIFIGTEYIQNKHELKKDKKFIPTFLISESNTYHHSIDNIREDSISVISISSNSVNEKYGYLSINLNTINVDRMLKNRVINLKDVPKKQVNSTIKIKNGMINNIGVSFNKINKELSLFIQDYDTNTATIVKYTIGYYEERYNFKTYQVNNSMNIDFNKQILMGSYEYNWIFYDTIIPYTVIHAHTNNGSQVTVFYDLNSNSTIIHYDDPIYNNFDFKYVITEQHHFFVVFANNKLIKYSVNWGNVVIETHDNIFPNTLITPNGNMYSIFKYPKPKVDMAQLYLKSIIPVSVVLILIVLFGSLYIFVYRKRKLEREKINQFTKEKEDIENKVQTTNSEQLVGAGDL